MSWLGINDGHHGLSHDPDSDKKSVEKLIKIDTWYCEQLAYLARRLAETPELGGPGSLLDNTQIVWTNESKTNDECNNKKKMVLRCTFARFPVLRRLEITNDSRVFEKNPGLINEEGLEDVPDVWVSRRSVPARWST